MGKRILIALGGNAILRPGQKGTYAQQMENIRISAEALVPLVEAGHKLIVTHGNGPQVGNLLIQNQSAANAVPPQPLQACVAQTQGQLGYMIQAGLDHLFRQKGLAFQTASIITRVLVDPGDKAFQVPSKPVGPFFSQEYAEEKIKLGETWLNDSNRGWRRVVASPLPRKILELEAIRHSFEYCAVTIAAGGGGIPVICKDGQLAGVDAVIDKDLASALLAQNLDVDLFAILTDVANAKLNFGRKEETDLVELTAAEAEKYLNNGEFGVGSMAPKMQAAVNFAQGTNKRALIASLTQFQSALEGKGGTVILP